MAKYHAALLALVALIACVLATPVPGVHDVHQTTVDLYGVEHESQFGRFVVRVERVDQIVDLDEKNEAALAADGSLDKIDGTLIATRISDVVVMFDVTPKAEVLINGKPVPMGMSNLQVEAEVITGVTAAGQKMMNAEQLKDAFETGIVGLKVFVQGQTSEDGVTRLTIAEAVNEVNGKEVIQQNVMEHVVEVHPDGTIVAKKPCAASKETIAAMGKHHGKKACMGRKISAWFQGLHYITKLLLAALLGVLLGVVAAAFMRIVTLFLAGPSNAGYVAVGEQVPVLVAVTMDADEKLPAYAADGYIVVEGKEKEVVEQQQQ
ncbi:uncharacterized protein EV422DRAFT_520270 [Fimicolochytrium jonesii]|uniref:uncharacterized protein n=1 Tax=Fimicolochytrium jonesii TaxID=1396493 RepID=UPI0022FE6A40|nr:uncharacterized protein EV422DRAFT_520270 [Fimicolochytrium jonesii]KAI8824487.1 hypothetical protein EV422DRAFT_520270 [Fimicolochytrium jonesii]